MTVYIFSENVQGERVERQQSAEKYYVYLLSDLAGSVICSGVSNNLKKKLTELKSKYAQDFMRAYVTSSLVYFEVFEDPYGAIAREKGIRGMCRSEKVALIESVNPQWNDLHQKVS